MSTRFAKKDAFDGYQDNAFFPPRFRSVIDDDLNGTFGLYHSDNDFTNSGDASYGLYSIHLSSVIVLEPHPNKLC